MIEGYINPVNVTAYRTNIRIIIECDKTTLPNSLQKARVEAPVSDQRRWGALGAARIAVR